MFGPQCLARTSASVDYRVVSDDVGFDAGSLHFLDPSLGAREVARLGTSMNHCGVAGDIGLNGPRHHDLQPFLRTVDVPAPCTSTDESIVHVRGGLHLCHLDLSEDPLNAKDVTKLQYGLHEDTVGTDAQAQACALRLIKPMFRLLDVADLDPSIDHNAVADRIHLYAILQHPLEPELCPVGILGACTSAEDSIVGDAIGWNACGPHLLDQHLRTYDIGAARK
mmetsp:Transcript_43817/g.93222  ORF Transcript_43817/g.93222 Transcript_43817/m.93222 type:complete len:223 (-) Transcript_43817:522-1190(-)